MRNRIRKNRYKKPTDQPPKSIFMRVADVVFKSLCSVAFIGGMSLMFIFGHDALTQCDYFKAQNIIDPSFHYDLWPFRLIMILIFTPLILYSPFLEFRFRDKFESAEEIKTRLIHEIPRYNPDHAMQFVGTPRIIEKPTKIRYPISYLDESGID